jgi:hypothetical protein
MGYENVLEQPPVEAERAHRQDSHVRESAAVAVPDRPRSLFS